MIIISVYRVYKVLKAIQEDKINSSLWIFWVVNPQDEETGGMCLWTTTVLYTRYPHVFKQELFEKNSDLVDLGA